MSEKCCRNCMYGRSPEGWLGLALRRWPAMLVCSACADRPGKVIGVHVGGVCRNFRAKRGLGNMTVSPERPDDEGCLIPLTNGGYAVVDPEDYEELSKYRWRGMQGKHTRYACRTEKGKMILMHRQIMQPPPGMVVDHIDLNGLYNRRRNLRVCTRGQNNCNMRPQRGGTGFRGVTLNEWNGKYKAAIHHQGRTIPLGEFDDPVTAAKVRDRKAHELHGPYAYLNFPEDYPPPRTRIISLSGTIRVKSRCNGTLTVVKSVVAARS